MVLENIYIVRHGYRIHWHVDPIRGIYSSSIRTPTGIPTDPPLASYGVKQAEQLGVHLLSMDPPINLIYSSPYYRCLQTLEPFVSNLATRGAQPQVYIDTGLGEFFGRAGFKHPRPASLEVLVQHFEHLNEHERGQSIVASERGETLPQLHDRVAYCLRELIRRADADPARPRSLLLCTHAAVIICAGRVLTGRMPDDIGEEDFGAYTCGVTTFTRRRKDKGSSGSESEEVKWSPERPDDIPEVHWCNGRGIEGGWDCRLDSDCSFLEGGAERGWRFSGDESFLTDPNDFNENSDTSSKSRL